MIFKFAALRSVGQSSSGTWKLEEVAKVTRARKALQQAEQTEDPATAGTLQLTKMRAQATWRNGCSQRQAELFR